MLWTWHSMQCLVSDLSYTLIPGARGIPLNFDGHLCSTAADMLVKFQSDAIIKIATGFKFKLPRDKKTILTQIWRFRTVTLFLIDTLLWNDAQSLK